MTHIASRQKFVALAISAALASTALGGCATQVAPQAQTSAGKAQTALAKGKPDQAVAHAEATVLAEPRSASYRAMLGSAYMNQGRFDAAATSFADAMELGDATARTALSYALAKIAQGDNPSALAVLDRQRGSLAPEDMGLAMALAGQADQGVAMLGQTLRNGRNSAKLRQNLAYAYALQGNWRAARLMAAEDVPADQLDARISEWARIGKPEDHRARVAGLLKVPVIADPGQPVALALNNHPGHGAMVAEAAAQIPVSVSAMARGSAAGELPALAPAATSVGSGYQPTPLPPLAEQAGAKPLPASFATAFADSPEARAPALPAGSNFAEVAGSAVRFISNPVVQTAPQRAKQSETRHVARQMTGQAEGAAKPDAKPAAPAQTAMATDGDHLVQLGSYRSETQARAGWNTLTQRYPQLDKFALVITEAEVRGKKYFRVSAGGFEKADARSMCSTMKGRGQGCIAWADGKPLPGALTRTTQMASR